MNLTEHARADGGRVRPDGNCTARRRATAAPLPDAVTAAR